MKASPMPVGIAVGAALPLLILAPAYLFGPLAEVLAAGRAYFLLPALALLLVPGVFAGQLASRYAPDRKAAWRFATGLFFGGSLVAALLLWQGAAEATLLRRLTIAAFGGPILAGFWLWLGCVLGLSFGYGRRERAEKAAEPANP